jgi:hypothetical protein
MPRTAKLPHQFAQADAVSGRSAMPVPPGAINPFLRMLWRGGLEFAKHCGLFA